MKSYKEERKWQEEERCEQTKKKKHRQTWILLGTPIVYLDPAMM
jgi:hypothetical protein